jgi:hypothetical protein
MFRVYLVPLTPFFPHHRFTVRGGFQELKPHERLGCAVIDIIPSPKAWREEPLNPVSYPLVTYL